MTRVAEIGLKQKMFDAISIYYSGNAWVFFSLSNGNLNIFDMMEKISVLIEIRTRVQGGRKLRKALVRSKKIWRRSRSRSAGEIALTFAFALTLKRFERRSILSSF